MPRGAAPGERHGGRAKGTPNKTLLQRAQELQAKVGLPAKIEYLSPLEPHDGPLARDILNHVMEYAAQWAAVYRPRKNLRVARECVLLARLPDSVELRDEPIHCLEW